MKNTVIKFGSYGLLLGFGLFLIGLLFMKDIDMSKLAGLATN